jgi:hypothetical protein
MNNNRKVGFIFVLSGVLLFVAALTNAQGIGDRNRASGVEGGVYSIQGRVVLPDGKPAKDVKVSISSTDTNTSVTTDRDGEFQTGGIHSGNYTLTAKVEGFPAESESVAIDRDSPPSQTFSIVIYIRMPGQKKGDIYSNNPLFKEVPKTALDKFKKGEDKLHANDAKGAIPLFDEAIAEYANFAPAYYERGSAYLKTNDLDKALESFVKAIQIKPDYEIEKRRCLDPAFQSSCCGERRRKHGSRSPISGRHLYAEEAECRSRCGARKIREVSPEGARRG